MYESYWRLRSRPFENLAEPRFYYPSEVHQGALLKLRYAIENRRGAALLTGAPGTGKTLLIQSLKRQLDETHTPFVHLVFPQMTPAELLVYLADELAAPPLGSQSQTVDHSLRRLQKSLAANADRGRQAVIAIDEAQCLLDSGVLETVRLLMNLEHAGQPVMTLLLSGQTALLPALARAAEFEERLGVKCLLRPLTLEETASYINHRLIAAGATHEIFTPAAVTRLHELTLGSPRRINRLCDLTLLIGFAEERPVIDADEVSAVAGELVNVAPE